MNPHRQALLRQGLADWKDPLKPLILIGSGFGFALGVGYVAYLADSKGTFGDSAAAGIGLLGGLGVWVLAMVWLAASGGLRGLTARLRHQPPIHPEHVLNLTPGEPLEDTLARFFRKSGRSDIRFGVGLIVACAAGAVALLLGGLHERSLTQAKPGWATATGQVQSYELVGCKGGCEWNLVVTFTVPGQGTIRFEPPNARSQPTVGAPVQVAYPPSDPSAAHDISDTNNDSAALLWLSPLALFVGLSVGGIMILSGRSDRRTAAKYASGDI